MWNVELMFIPCWRIWGQVHIQNLVSNVIRRCENVFWKVIFFVVFLIAMFFVEKNGNISHSLPHRKRILNDIWWPTEELQPTLCTCVCFLQFACFFQGVNACMQNVCHSVSRHVEQGSVSVCVSRVFEQLMWFEDCWGLSCFPCSTGLRRLRNVCVASSIKLCIL